MKTTFLAILPLPPNEVSPNRTSHSHWRHRHRATKAYREVAWGHFIEAKPVGWCARPVLVEVDYYCCRRSQGYKPRDTQNAMAALKAAVDGMVDARIVPSDSGANVKWAGMRLHSVERDLLRAPPEHHVDLDGCVVFTITAL